MQTQTVLQLKMVLFFLLSGAMAWAQKPDKPEEKKPAPQMSPAARIAAAKTAFIKKGGGSNTPVEVISATLEGWGKFTLVDAPEKADIIIAITSTGDSPVTVTSSFGISQETGQPEQSSRSSKEITTNQITLTVLDQKTKVSLWTGTEKPKRAMKKVEKENNEVEAAQRLAARFHDFVEPPQK